MIISFAFENEKSSSYSKKNKHSDKTLNQSLFRSSPFYFYSTGKKNIVSSYRHLHSLSFPLNSQDFITYSLANVSVSEKSAIYTTVIIICLVLVCLTFQLSMWVATNKWFFLLLKCRVTFDTRNKTALLFLNVFFFKLLLESFCYWLIYCGLSIFYSCCINIYLN